MLTGQPGIELAGEAASGIELLQFVRTTRPDVVVTDLAMPGLTGAQAAALLAEQPEVAVLVLTMHQDDGSLFEAMRAGARWYLLKASDRADLIAAIQAIARREAVYGPGVAQRIIRLVVGKWFKSLFKEATSQPSADGALLAAGSARDAREMLPGQTGLLT